MEQVQQEFDGDVNQAQCVHAHSVQGGDQVSERSE